MGNYTFLDHTADEKFRVEATDLNDAFATALQAFYEILLGKVEVKRKHARVLALEAKKLTSLLYDFLNELVFYFDDEGLLLQHVETLSIIKTETGYALSATVTGDVQYDYELITEIKNVTYSDMEIRQTEQGVELVVVVDI
jgi:SHS2 domain-containing protein